MRPRCSPTRRLPSRHVADLVELGLHHEQQHQELLLMDAKHLLCQNPTAPRLRRPVATRIAWSDAQAPAGSHATAAASSRSATDGDGFSYDNEGPRHDRAARAVPAGRPAGHLRRMAGVHRTTAATGAAELWLSDGWHRATPRGGTPRSTGGTSTTAGWSRCSRSAADRRRPAEPSPTSATTRPTPSPAGPAPGSPPRPSGRRRSATRPSDGPRCVDPPLGRLGSTSTR